jgi:Ca2+-binding RTX toxin-like protein
MMALKIRELLGLSSRSPRKPAKRVAFRSAIGRNVWYPNIESLEERALLAVVTWDGEGGDNLWENPLNWDTDELPTAVDDVVIAGLPSSGGTFVTLNSLQQIKSLRLAGKELVSSGFVYLYLNSLPAALEVTEAIELTNSEMRLTGTTVSAAAVVLGESSALFGVGTTIFGDVVNDEGRLGWNNTGVPLGPLIIDGNYTQAATAQFLAKVDAIANTSGQVQVTGNAALNGTLIAYSLTDDPLDLSQSFDVLTFGTSTGTFHSRSWQSFQSSHFFMGPPSFSFNVNSNSIELTGAVHVVSSSADAGAGSLRQALEDANERVNAEWNVRLIAFRNSVGTINLESPLPVITRTVEIDARVMSTYSGSPLIHLNGAGLGPTQSGIVLSDTAGFSIISGLSLTGFSYPAIQISSSDNRIHSNYIGILPDGATAAPNETGIWLRDGASRNVIGGNSFQQNVISGNTAHGILLTNPGTNDNRIQGNYIGTDASGNGLLGNGQIGVFVNAGPERTIIGSDSNGFNDALEGNVISGNTTGIYLQSNVVDTVIAGNTIGLNATGNASLGVQQYGIWLDGGTVTGTVIGTNGDGVSDALERNILSGNTQIGVRIDGSDNSIIAGNFFGLSRDGSSVIPGGQAGISLGAGTVNTRIGTNSDGVSDTLERNVIVGSVGNPSGNNYGILLTGPGTELNTIAGNFVGVGPDGLNAMGNAVGVLVQGGTQNTLIGGTTPASRNIISGNSGNGVSILGAGTAGNSVIGNYIGLATDGATVLGNNNGVSINGAPGNFVGGGLAGEGNVISGNNIDVSVSGLTATDNRVQGNRISMSADGLSLISPSFGYGVYVANGAQDTIIGTDSNNANDANEGNLIGFASTAAVFLQDNGAAPNRTVIAGNRIGLDALGASLGTGVRGIWVLGATNTRIGSDANGISDAHERNVIVPSANGGWGVLVTGGTNVVTSGTTIAGNYIGLDTTGNTGLSNNATLGIVLLAEVGNGIANTLIGGTEVSARNVIGSMNVGIEVSGTLVSSTAIQGNFVGTNVTGDSAIGNRKGISISGAQNVVVGGATAAERNVISGNSEHGILLEGIGTNENRIQGNYIGTDATGLVAIAGLQDGIGILNGASRNVIGGSSPGAGNVISGNGIGVRISGIASEENVIFGNIIGLGVDRNTVIANAGNGIRIVDSPRNRIGSGQTGSGNLLAGNSIDVSVIGAAAAGNLIQGNTFSMNAANDTYTQPSFGYSIWVTNGAMNTIIGTDSDGVDDASEANTMAMTATAAIFLQELSGLKPTGTVIAGNRIGTNQAGDSYVGAASAGRGVWVAGADNTRIGTLANSLSNSVEGNQIVPSANSGYGILLSGNNDGLTISGNLIGTNALGDASLTSLASLGIEFALSGVTTNAVVGGTNIADRNVIVGLGTGIVLRGPGASNATVLGNYLGTNATGTAAIGNRFGMRIFGGAQNIVVGGTAPGARNVISGSLDEAILIDGIGTANNSVVGNYIGLNSDGDAAIANRRGVRIQGGATGNTIGGDTPAHRNVISGSTEEGVVVLGAATSSNTIAGNFIGLAADGNTILSNLFGVDIFGAGPNNVVGGPTSASRNVISGNTRGIRIANSNGTQVQSNFIGTDATGSLDRGNELIGVWVIDSNNVAIGGDTVTPGLAPGNVISGTGNLSGTGTNVLVAANAIGTTSGTTLAGNLIGIDATGTFALDPINSATGVYLQGTTGVMIGGASALQRNIISGHSSSGLTIDNAGGAPGMASNNTVAGNYFGSDRTGLLPLGNGRGIALQLGASSNVIGLVAAGNLVGFSVTAGIDLGSGATSNTIAFNSIGVSPLDIDQPNTIGVRVDSSSSGNSFNDNVVRHSINDNFLIAGPATLLRRNVSADMGGQAIRLNPTSLSPGSITVTGVVGGNNPLVQGEFTAQPNSTYTIDLFSSAVENVAERFVASVVASTDMAGFGTFSVSPGAGLLNGFVTATLSGLGGGGVTSTSALSPSLLATPAIILGLRSQSPEGTPITLTAFASTNPVVGYLWTVTKDGSPYEFESRPDGTQIDGGIQFTPDDEGLYTVSLRVTLEDGSTFLLGPYTINVFNVAPTPAFEYLPSSPIAGQPITLTANNNDPGALDQLTSAWEVRQGSPMGPIVFSLPATLDTTTSFTPFSGGFYYVTLTVNDGDGGQSSLTRELEVRGLPVDATIILSDTTVREGDTVRARAPEAELNRTEQLTFTWTLTKTSGVTTSAYPFSVPAAGVIEFIPNDDGIYTVGLTISDASGSVFAPPQVVTVGNVAPVVTIIPPAAPPAIGVPQTFTTNIFDRGSADTHTVDWTVALAGQSVPVASGSGLNFTFTPTAAGIYIVSVVATDDDGGQGSSKTSFAIATDGLSLSIQSPAGPFIEGNNYTFTASVPSGVVGYAWRARTANTVIESTGTSSNFVFTPQQGGVYLVELSVTLADGRSIATSVGPISVVATAPTIHSMTIVSPTSTPIYEGTSVTVRAVASDPREPIGLSYLWALRRPGEAEFTSMRAVVGQPRDFQFVPEDDGPFEVRLTVRDSQGILAQQILPVTILNADPIVRLSAEHLSGTNQVRFEALADDPGALDRPNLQIAWSVNGSVAVPGGKFFTTSLAGLNQVKVRVTDGDGGLKEINYVVVQGTGGNDTIHVNSNTSYTLNHGTPTTISNSTDPLLVLGLDGNDTIVIAGAVTRPVLVLGGDGNDTIDASATTVRMILDGGAGNDTLRGGSGDDLLIAGPGTNYLHGGEGNNYFLGGGSDTMIGGAGNDYYRVHFSVVVLEDSGGNDTIDLTDAQSGVTFNLSDNNGGEQTVFAGSTLAITGNFETLIGSRHNDTLTSNSANTILRGGEGNDTLISAAQNVILDGGDGNDIFHVAGASGTIVSSSGNNSVIGSLSTTDSTTIALGDGDDRVEVSGISSDQLSTVSISLGDGDDNLFAQYISGTIYAANGSEDGTIESFGTASPGSTTLVVSSSSDIDIFGGVSGNTTITVVASSDIDIYGTGTIQLSDSEIARITITDFGVVNSSSTTLTIVNTSDIDIFGLATGSSTLTATLTNSSDIDIFGSTNGTSYNLTLNSSSDVSIYGVENGSIELNNVSTGVNILDLGLFGSTAPTDSQLLVMLNASSNVDIFGSAVRGDLNLTLNSSSDIDIFGAAAGSNQVLVVSSSDIDIFGSATLGSHSITIAGGSTDIDIFGISSATSNTISVSASSNIDIFGSSTQGTLAVTIDSGSSDIDIFAASTPGNQTITVTNSTDIDIFGSSSPGSSTVVVQNSNNIDIFGSVSATDASITLDNSSNIGIFGSSTTGNVSVTILNSQNVDIFGAATSGDTHVTVNQSSSIDIFGGGASGPSIITIAASSDIDIFGSSGGTSTVKVIASQDIAIYGSYGDSVELTGVQRARIEGGIFGSVASGGTQIIVNGNSSDIAIFGTETTDEVSIEDSSLIGMNLRSGHDRITVRNSHSLLLLTDAGDDYVTVESGNDMLVYLGSGDDWAELLGGANIRVIGESGDDQFIVAGGSNIQCDGGDGDDQVFILGGGGIRIRGDSGADQIRVFGGVGIQASAGSGNDLLQLFGSLGGTLPLGSVYALLDGQDGDDTLEIRPLLSVDDRGPNAVATVSFPHLYLPTWATVPNWLANPQQTSYASSIALVGGVGNDTLWLEGSARLYGLGGDGDDHITLQRGAISEVAGGQGNDVVVINAAGADNRVFGDRGDDQITANDGLRLGLFGQEGIDTIRIFGGRLVFARGGTGDDILEIHGGDSNVLSGEEGADGLTIFGGLRGIAAGGMGDDELEIAGGDYGLLLGQSGRDTLRLTGGRFSILSGGDGDDTLQAWGRDADLYGDDGDDTYQLMIASTATLNESSLLRLRELIFVTSFNIESESRGADTIDLSNFLSAATIDLGLTGLINDPMVGLQTVIVGQLGLILLGSIENVIGTEFDDLLIGSNEANLLDGRGGNDQIWGLGGDDILIGGTGNDLLIGGLGNDVYVFAAESGVSLGNDTIYEDAGGGVDGLDFRGLPVGLGTLDLNLTTSQVLAGGLLQLTLRANAGASQPAEIEELVGTNYNDTVIGNNLDNRFELLSGINVVDGRGGSDIYTFAGEVTGSTTIIDSPSGSGRDTLDFARFDYPIDIDLAIATPQLLGPMTLTLTSGASIENVIGTSFNDQIFGNALDNALFGAGGRDIIDGRGGNDRLVADLPQVVLLDFDSAFRAERGDYDYSAAERAAILARVTAAFAPFNWKFTLVESQAQEWSADMARNFVRLEFSKGRGGGVSGDAGEVDFRNVQRRVISEVNVNPLLPTVADLLTRRHGPNYTAQQFSDMVVALTSTIAAHELGHTAGLRHGDAFGPIGTGLFTATRTDLMWPEYTGAMDANETPWHIIASPLSVGSTIEDATRLTFFGAREAIKLAFNEIGITQRERATEIDSHGSIVTAEDLGELQPLTVPNLTPSSAFALFGQTFRVSALAVVGELRAEMLAGQAETEFDYYRFVGKAGDIVNIELLANSVRPLRGNLFDGELRVYKADGTQIAFNDDDFEGTKDATILDLILEEDGEYFVAVGLSVSPAILAGGGRYELFLSRFSVGVPLAVPGDTLISGSGNSLMIGSAADDLFLAAGATPASVLTLDGRDGTDTFDMLGLSFTYNSTSIEQIAATVNTPPTVSLTAPTDALVGSVVQVTISVSDLDAVDASGPFTLVIDWGDGSGLETVVLPAGTTSVVLPHIFARVSPSGYFDITVTSVDGRGAISQPVSASHAATGWSVMADPINPSQTILVIVGTSHNDFIQMRHNGNDWLRIRISSWEADVRVRGRVTGDDVSLILVHGLDGHDKIDLRGVTIDAQIWGGGGNDVIHGGDGHDMIWGGAGSDIIDGGRGRDILIGGTGADLLLGDKDDDILVAGLTAYDQEFNSYAPESYFEARSRLAFDAQRAAIQAIMAEWTSNRSYTQRRDNIMGTGTETRNNQMHFLRADAAHAAHNTVFDDGAYDRLSGQAGQDWFFAHTWKSGRSRIDSVWDSRDDETITDVDWWWE